jgi:hypothetical protein
MRTVVYLCCAGLLAGLCGSLTGCADLRGTWQDEPCGAPQAIFGPPGVPPDLQKPDTQKPDTQKPDTQKPDTQTPEQPTPSPGTSGTELGSTGGFNPAMFGRIIGGPYVTTTVRLANGSTRTARVPALTRGSFQIADNEHPRPTDRVFLNYNYFNNVAALPQGSGVPGFDVHRETFGFEKTFLDGNASVGMRLPYLQTDGAGFGQATGLGDLTFILKYAFLNDLQTGNVVSGGLCVTAPTGDNNFIGSSGDLIHTTLLQPYGGFFWNAGGGFFVQGFSSIGVPTDNRDATVWYNDLAIGFWLYRSPDARQLLQGVVPTLEGHLLTPLNHRGSDSTPVGVPDFFSITAGLNFVLGRGSTLGVAVGIPMTGPRGYDAEGFVSMNFRF